MLFDDIDNIDGDPKLAEALGQMIVAWSHAETALSLTLSAASGMDPNMAMMAFYRIPTFESRTKTIQAIIGAWDDKTRMGKEEISTLVDKLSRLSATRNGWVHGIWSKSQSDGQHVVFNLRAPDEANKRRKPVKAHDINQHTETVRATTTALRKLVPYQDF